MAHNPFNLKNKGFTKDFILKHFKLHSITGTFFNKPGKILNIEARFLSGKGFGQLGFIPGLLNHR